MDCGAQRRFSTGTTKIRGFSSMTSFPTVFVIWFAEVSLGRLTANNGDHALMGSAHAKTRDDPRPLGKNSRGNRHSWPSRFFHRPRAKNRNTPPPLGKILEKPPMMATTLSWTAIAPKPATSSGKFEWEPVYHGDHAFSRWRSCQSRRPAWGNSLRNPFMMAIPQEKAALTPKPATFDRLGEISSGTRLSWRSRNQA